MLGIFGQTALNLIAFIPVDAKNAEVHLPSATASNHALENGTKITDHVFLNPTIVEIEFVVTSFDDPFGNISSSLGARSALTLNLLFNMLEKRQRHTIVTRQRLYSNMVLLKPEIRHEAPSTGTITGKVTFQQVNLANLSNVLVAIEQVSPDVAFAANTITNFGNVLTETLEETSDFFDPILDKLGF